MLPVVFEGQVKGVLELASFERFNPTHQAFLDQLTESIGIVLNTIEANSRTEDLLRQSQSLAQELQSRQEELQQTNQELAEKAQLLAEQNVAFAKRLHEAGVAAEKREYAGATHSFLEAVSIAEVAGRALDDCATWLRKRLRASS